MRKTLIIVLVLIVAIVVLYMIFGGRKPAIVVLPASYDFGEIVQGKGKVSTDFTVKNIGSAPLKFNRVSTSCGCTTAEIDKTDLAPGAGKRMKVVFDPLVHIDQFGPIVRVVYLQTNDPETPELEVAISAKVIK